MGVAAQGVGLIATQEFPLPTPRSTSSPWIQLALDQLQIELEAPPRTILDAHWSRIEQKI